MQYEFNSSLLDATDGAIKAISKRKLSAANSELERVKALINKRNKLIPSADKSPAGWTAVEEYESDEFARRFRGRERTPISREASARQD